MSEDSFVRVISPFHCYNILQQVELCPFIVDTRCFEKYEEDHLRCSICMYFDSFEELDELDFEDPRNSFAGRFRSFRSKRLFVLYGDKEQIDKMISFFKSEGMEDKKGCVIYILEDYDRFKDKYPFLVTTRHHPSIEKDLPAEICEDFLWLGSKYHAFSEPILKVLGITHIVNPTEELSNKFEEENEKEGWTKRLHYFPNRKDVLRDSNLCGIGDRVTDSLMNILPASIEFLEKAKKQNGKVLVHCNMGISRSSSIVIAWLMKHKGMDFPTAKKYTKEKRTIIKPNPTFEKELIEWGKTLQK